MSTSHSSPPPLPKRKLVLRKIARPEEAPAFLPKVQRTPPGLNDLASSDNRLAAAPAPERTPVAGLDYEEAARVGSRADAAPVESTAVEAPDTYPDAGFDSVDDSVNGPVEQPTNTETWEPPPLPLVHPLPPPNPSPLPSVQQSRASVLPFVASVSPAPESGPVPAQPSSRGNSLYVAVLLAAAAAIAGAFFLQSRGQAATASSAVAAAASPRALPPSAEPVANPKQPGEAVALAGSAAVATANIDDLPRAPNARRAVPPQRPARPSTPAKKAASSNEGVEQQASETATPEGSASAAEPSPDPSDFVPVAPPPADPLIKAVEQSIDEDTRQK
jgi:hypothetical protein